MRTLRIYLQGLILSHINDSINTSFWANSISHTRIF